MGELMMNENEMKAEQIRQIACEAAEKVLANATVTATAMQEKTAISIEYIKADIASIKTALEKNFVTHEAFDPVRNIVYGMLSAVGLAVLSALMYLILK